MNRVKLGLSRPNPELRSMKKNDPLHSNSDQNLREMINVAEKDYQAAMVATVHTDQTTVPSSSSYSSHGDDDDKQNNREHDQFHQNIVKGREPPVNYASRPCKSKKQVQNRHASRPDYRHTSEASHYSNWIGCDQPLMMKQEPVIIHTTDSRIIHTEPGNFMLLVQSLTGSCTTRAALCKQSQEEKQRKRKRNDYAWTATDEVQHEAIDGMTVNERLQQQKVKQQQQKKKTNDKNMSIKRHADEQVQCCSQLTPAAYDPIQSSHLSAHDLTHEPPSSSMDSHQKFAESPSLETDNLSSSPSHRLQDEGSMGSSPNISINYDTSCVTPFSKSWNMFTDSITSSPVRLPSFHGDQQDADCTAMPWKSESINIDSMADSYVENITCWPVDEDAVAVGANGDWCFSHGFQLTSAKNGVFNMEDHCAEYIYESSFRIPSIIDFNVSSLCRSMPEILDIDSLFACAADQIVQ